MLHLDDELLFEAVHIPRPPPSSKKATQVVGVIAHLDGHLHKGPFIKDVINQGGRGGLPKGDLT